LPKWSPGYHLTLTYNLSFGNSLDLQAVVSTPTLYCAALFTSLIPNAASFQSALYELLADKTFLPNGGLLGFGLSYEYPLATKGSCDDDDELVRTHRGAAQAQARQRHDRAGGAEQSACAVCSTSATEGEGRIPTSGLLRYATSFRISTANTRKGGVRRRVLQYTRTARYS